MRMPWKLVAGLLLALPVGAYAFGTVTSSDVDVPAERAPIVLQDAGASAGPRPDRPAPGGSDRPSPRPSSPTTERPHVADDGGSGDQGVDVVNPRPDDIERADDDAGRDDDTGDDTGDDTDDDTGDDTHEDDRDD